MTPLVSIIVVTRNHGKYINDCINSLLSQSFNDIEIIIIDDASTDNTENNLKYLNSNKLKYFKNISHLNIAKSRNIGIDKSKGKYVFFTDADCIPSKYWVQAAIECFGEYNCLGVEGKTMAEHQNFGASFHFVENITGGQYQTCNIAYKKDILEQVGGFNERYVFAYEDIDLALRIKNLGEIKFCSDMIVFHRLVKWTSIEVIKNAFRANKKVLLVKEHAYRQILKYGILEPNTLIQALFPFLIPLYYRIKSLDDVTILPAIYLRAVLHRLIVWKTAIEERYFIL